VRLLIDDQQEIGDGARRLLQQALELVLEAEGERKEAEVSLSLVDNGRITVLNREYRGVDTVTDVLSFPLLEDDQDEPVFPQLTDEQGEYVPLMLGDIVIAVPRAREQAERWGHPLEHELAWLAVHGLLHLLGYDHCTPEEERLMRRREEEVLRQLGIRRLWHEAGPDA
jgi:probable rRNA maturation factor